MDYSYKRSPWHIDVVFGNMGVDHASHMDVVLGLQDYIHMLGLNINVVHSP